MRSQSGRSAYRARVLREGKRNEEIRGYLNKIHELEEQLRQAKAPLENRIGRLEGDLQTTRTDNQALVVRLNAMQSKLSDAELYALAAFVATEHQAWTEARKRLATELEVRNVIARAT